MMLSSGEQTREKEDLFDDPCGGWAGIGTILAIYL